MTIFEAGLEKIVDDIAECYSRPLEPVQQQLKKIEEEEDAVLDRMEDYGRGMFESLSACFSQEDTQLVIECLQKVEGTNTGKYFSRTFPFALLPSSGEENLFPVESQKSRVAQSILRKLAVYLQKL